MREKTNWILFAKRPSRDNCIGKAKINDAKFDVAEQKIYLDITINGEHYNGFLQKPVDEEE